MYRRAWLRHADGDSLRLRGSVHRLPTVGRSIERSGSGRRTGLVLCAPTPVFIARGVVWCREAGRTLEWRDDRRGTCMAAAGELGAQSSWNLICT